MSTGEILCPERSKYIEWKFDNFCSLLKKKHSCIKSPHFSFAGTTLYFLIHPNAQDGDAGWIVVHLCSHSQLDAVTFVSGQLGIKRDASTMYMSRIFHHFNIIRKFDNFLKRSTMWADIPHIAPRDEVTFFCWLNTFDLKCCREAETQTSEHEAGIYKLSEDFKDLYLNGKDYDTTIKIADREFQAHRLVLGARSPVFTSMYSHDTTERSTGIVEIQDCDPETFQNFLIFLYSGKVESLSSENVLGLYAIADKYDVEEVKQVCLKFMISNFSIEDFCDVVALALKYNESELLKSASDFFVKNVKKITVTPQWLGFHRDYPVESNELCIKAFQLYVPD